MNFGNTSAANLVSEAKNDKKISMAKPSLTIFIAGSKPICVRYGEGMSFDKVHFSDANRWIMVLPLERCISTHQRISFYISSCILG